MIHERIYLDPADDRVWIDTYIANDKTVKPAMLVIPGGGYSSISQFLEGEPIALAFFSRGYNTFVLNYGVHRPGDVFPKQLIDAGRAMIYIREHREELSVDPERVFAIGFSAGGHLCGSLAAMFEYDEVKALFGEKAPLIRPTGAILSYPVTVAFENAHKGSFINLFGKPYEEITDEEKRKVSLDFAVSEKTSPMYIWHTAEDQVVPVQGSLRLAHVLKNKGVPFMLSVFPYGPHAIGLGNEITKRGNDVNVQPIAAVWVEQACSWMKTVKSS